MKLSCFFLYRKGIRSITDRLRPRTSPEWQNATDISRYDNWLRTKTGNPWRKCQKHAWIVKGKADSKAIETRLQKIETPVKQSKDVQKSIKNSVKDDEEEEIKLGKQRDQIGDRELMPEERRKSFETSSESNYNSVLLETSSSENELAADITPDAPEHDDFHVGLDRQKNARFLDRATSPIQSESEC